MQGRLKTIGGPRLDSNGGPLFFPNFQNTYVLTVYLILGIISSARSSKNNTPATFVPRFLLFQIVA